MLNLVANLIKVKIEAEARQFKAKLKRALNQTWGNDNRMAAEIADSYPELPKKEAYQNEVMKGVYSR